MFGARILLLIPHPDDEALGAALAIREAVRQGATVLGLDLTHGCPPRATLWPWQRAGYARRVARRRAEARRAAAALGLERIADDDLPARALLANLDAQFRRALIAVYEHRIDTIWVPAYEGGHADHDAANAIAEALRRTLPALAFWEFAEYNNARGRLASNEFPVPGAGERVIALDSEEDGRWKTSVLACYASERGNLGNVSDSRVFREAFRPLPAHDYASPPHSGRLFYERFHWLPFRHPRIDGTTGRDACAAISAFLRRRVPSPSLN
jgi:LmbE family N-acetylglucosaminyl deacetylase